MSKAMKLAAKDLQSPENRQKYTICIVGCGRIGLITASLLVKTNFKVIGVDSNPHIIHQLKKGKSPFTETHLRKLIEPHIKNSYFRATTNLRKAVSESNIIISSMMKTAAQITIMSIPNNLPNLSTSF